MRRLCHAGAAVDEAETSLEKPHGTLITIKRIDSDAARTLSTEAAMSDRPTEAPPHARRDSAIILRISSEALLALQELSQLLVGQMSLQDAQRALRKAMSQEALERCDGSRRAAAALLDIDRRYVQRLANESNLDGLDDETSIGMTG
jgi:DNA-binding NtrC family response regulator